MHVVGLVTLSASAVSCWPSHAVRRSWPANRVCVTLQHVQHCGHESTGTLLVEHAGDSKVRAVAADKKAIYMCNLPGRGGLGHKQTITLCGLAIAAPPLNPPRPAAPPPRWPQRKSIQAPPRPRADPIGCVRVRPARAAGRAVAARGGSLAHARVQLKAVEPRHPPLSAVGSAHAARTSKHSTSTQARAACASLLHTCVRVSSCALHTASCCHSKHPHHLQQKPRRAPDPRGEGPPAPKQPRQATNVGTCVGRCVPMRCAALQHCSCAHAGAPTACLPTEKNEMHAPSLCRRGARARINPPAVMHCRRPRSPARAPPTRHNHRNVRASASESIADCDVHVRARASSGKHARVHRCGSSSALLTARRPHHDHHTLQSMCSCDAAATLHIKVRAQRYTSHTRGLCTVAPAGGGRCARDNQTHQHAMHACNGAIKRHTCCYVAVSG